MQAPSPATSLQPAVSLLEKTPALLEVLLRDLSGDLLFWKPAPDRWSITDVLEHLVVIEQLYETRARRIFMEENPNLTKYIPPDEVQKKSPKEYFDSFATQRRAFVVFLRSVPNSAGPRTGRHQELGRITLSELLNELANHDLGHIRQIAELYRAHSFYPYAGPFQKYSSPRP